MTVPPQADALTPPPAVIRSRGAEPPSVAAAEFRAALTGLTTAVSVIATDGPAGKAGLTCSAVCGISDTPATVVACVNRRSAALAAIQANGVLCINSLPATRKDLSQVFAGVGQVPMVERFAGAGWSVLATGAPHHTDALVAFDCELMEVHDVGTHSVLIGRVLATTQGAAPNEPLIYHRQQYATTRAI